MLLAMRSLQHLEIAGRYDSPASLDGSSSAAAARGRPLLAPRRDAGRGGPALGDGSAGGEASRTPHYQRGPSGVFRAASGDFGGEAHAADHIQIVGGRAATAAAAAAAAAAAVAAAAAARACFEVHGALAFLERVLLEQGKLAQHRRLGYVTACARRSSAPRSSSAGVQLPALSALGAEAVAEVAGQGLRRVPVAPASPPPVVVVVVGGGGGDRRGPPVSRRVIRLRIVSTARGAMVGAAAAERRRRERWDAGRRDAASLAALPSSRLDASRARSLVSDGGGAVTAAFRSIVSLYLRRRRRRRARRRRRVGGGAAIAITAGRRRRYATGGGGVDGGGARQWHHRPHDSPTAAVHPGIEARLARGSRSSTR